MYKISTKKTIYCFKHWNNKNYSVFNSLHKIIKIGVLSAIYTMLTTNAEVKGQTDSSSAIKIHELDEITISPEEILLPENKTSVLQIITQQDIKNSPAQSLPELLEYTGSIDIRQRGPDGIQADISLRGGTFDQVIVLLNGIDFTNPQTGHYTLNLPIDLDNIERIEILRGNDAGMYAASSFTGIINIITSPEKENHIKAGISMGEYNFKKGNISLLNNKSKIKQHLSGSASGSSGYRHNTDFKNINGFYHATYQSAKGGISLQAGYGQKEFGANSFYSARYPDQYDENKTVLTSLQGYYGEKLKIKPAIYWQRHYDHYTLIKQNPWVYQNFHQAEIAGAILAGLYTGKHGTLLLSVNHKNENILSNNLGIEFSPPRPITFFNTDTNFHKKSNRYVTTYTFEKRIYYKKIIFEHTINTIHFSETEKIKIYPAVTAGYKLLKPLKIIASLKKAYRQPTFTDLYYKSRTNTGNPLLKPEESRTIEGGIQFNSFNINASAFYFIRKGQNIIDWAWNGTTKKWEALNIAGLTTQGIESTIHYIPKKIPTLKKSSISYTYITQNKDENEYQSLYALDHLQQKLTLSEDIRIYKNIGITGYFNWQKRNGTYQQYIPETKADITKPYKEIFLIDSKIYWNNKTMMLYLQGSNLLNKNYFDIGNVIQPGRWIRAGVNLTL